MSVTDTDHKMGWGNILKVTLTWQRIFANLESAYINIEGVAGTDFVIAVFSGVQKTARIISIFELFWSRGKKNLLEKIKTFWRNYPTMHRFLTTVSLHFRLDQKCMLVELGACVTDCLKSFNSLGEFSMRCPRRTPTHFFLVCAFW